MLATEAVRRVVTDPQPPHWAVRARAQRHIGVKLDPLQADVPRAGHHLPPALRDAPVTPEDGL
ncbi:hypothetical protein [Streptomyces tricolor]|uniref:hypothetical protein n=1 Tax=Streptomyces tricolor TaxID=68277 RepID=UPI0036E9178C